MLYSLELYGIPYLIIIEKRRHFSAFGIYIVSENFDTIFASLLANSINEIIELTFKELSIGFPKDIVSKERVMFSTWLNSNINTKFYLGSSKKHQQFEKDGISTL